MTICMCKLICVTNRKLCGDFLGQVANIAAARPDRIILREKDLEEDAYRKLAEEVLRITPCTLHCYARTAMQLGVREIHLPLPVFREMQERQYFDTIGVSCHSAAEAREAQRLGASYIIAGHIFATDCKKGLPPRGTAFLKEIKASVDIPVYAIGGITENNAAEVIAAGADGICLMSGFMQSREPDTLIKKWRELLQ